MLSQGKKVPSEALVLVQSKKNHRDHRGCTDLLGMNEYKPLGLQRKI